MLTLILAVVDRLTDAHSLLGAIHLKPLAAVGVLLYFPHPNKDFLRPSVGSTSAGEETAG
jgi:hypothetical protein